MLHSRVHIEAGDMVILFISRENMVAIHVNPGDVFHNKYGRYAHNDMIGMKYGSKMHSPPPHSGYLHLLRPSPELWTLSLPHRTQILYMPDIAYINAQLRIRPGVNVIEAGTGSGSMTHTLARGVGSRGVVRSYEYHQQRYEKALEEFKSHSLANVALQHRNVCKEGFGDAENISAVFLDLPAPWEAIPHAIKTFKEASTARICCFSPCLEQVLKTVSTLRLEGFQDVFTQEVLVRNHELVTPPSNAPPPFRTISSIVDKLQRHETKKEERRLIQMKTAREKARKKKEAEQAANGTPGRSEARESSTTVEEPTLPVDSKKRKLEESELEEATRQTSKAVKDTDSLPLATSSVGVRDAETGDIADAPVLDDEEDEDMSGSFWTEPDSKIHETIVTKPAAEMRGHTSYLTFACYYPAKVRNELEAQEEPKAPSSRNRLATLLAEGGKDQLSREGSLDTDYGDDGLDQVMGTLTEEEMVGLGVKRD